MSKVLKFIVNLVVLLSIVVAAALLVPPLLGVDTVINDNSNIETNLPVGAVAYGKQVDTEGLKKEDKIIYIEGSAQYVYEIQDMDTTAGAYKVKDVYNKNSDVESITLQDKVSKAVVTIPFIGYAAIALQSKTGLMVVGAVIVLLIILFILSEVLRRGDDEDEDEDDEDDEEEDDDEEEEPGYWERRRLRKEEKRRRKLEKKGLLEEDDEKEEQEETEELFVPEDTSSEAVSSESPQELQGFDEAMKDAMSSIASGIAQVSEPENVPDATVIMPDAEEIEKAVQETEETSMMVEALEEQEVAEEVETETEEALETNEEQINEEVLEVDEEQINEEILEADEEPISEEAENDVPEDIAEDIIIEETQTEVFAEEENPVNVNAVPKTPSIDELLAKAAEAGEQPEVKKDEENEVTLLDYSDLL